MTGACPLEVGMSGEAVDQVTVRVMAMVGSLGAPTTPAAINAFVPLAIGVHGDIVPRGTVGE